MRNIFKFNLAIVIFLILIAGSALLCASCSSIVKPVLVDNTLNTYKVSNTPTINQTDTYPSSTNDILPTYSPTYLTSPPLTPAKTYIQTPTPTYNNPYSFIDYMEVSKITNKLIVVIGDVKNISKCNVSAYQKVDDVWVKLFSVEGLVGINGIKYNDRHEGDGTTPGGVYSLGKCFGILDNPGGVIKEYTKITDDDYWDGDKFSQTYNTWVKASSMPETWDKDNSEHLIDYPVVYNYSVAINFNIDPTISGLDAKGSAIFLHCSRPGGTYTLGCVAIPQWSMETCLRFIDNSTKIVIVANENDLKNY